MKIIGLTKEELLKLQPFHLTPGCRGGEMRALTKEEIVYIATTLGAFWKYDYEALKEGRPGFHALLKSGLHSDGFLVSKIMLALVNIRVIVASQVALSFKQLGMQKPDQKPDWVAGIPDGATELGRLVASILGAKEAVMVKEEGKIKLVSEIAAGETLLLVEDFCTRGTGFKEVVREILFNNQPPLPVETILPVELVLINRGGLKDILVEGIVQNFKIVSLAEHRVRNWKPEDCPLCKAGSKPIKPKATEENWRLITTAQLA